MLPFFYIAVIPETSSIVLDAETSHHMAQVLRMTVGDQLHLTDGQGTLITGFLQAVSKKSCMLTVTNRSVEARSGRGVHIAIAPIKNSGRFEWFVEKATELGISSISPILTNRTEKKGLRLDRIRQVAIAAMLQSQQTWMPILNEPVSYADVLSAWSKTQRQLLVAHCLSDARSAISKVSLKGDVGILIGPEGDFTPSEISMALEAGAAAVLLGATRLRTETAGVAAATWLRLQH